MVKGVMGNHGSWVVMGHAWSMKIVSFAWRKYFICVEIDYVTSWLCQFVFVIAINEMV